MTHAQRREIDGDAGYEIDGGPDDGMGGAGFLEVDGPEADEGFQDELAPGTQLLQGQYRITRFLNAGGFGITYLAKDSLERQVVIKECFPGAFCRRSQTIVSPRSRAHQNEFRKIVRLFVQEARSLAKLQHPNIVGVHQVFEDNDTAYMAIDFVDGQDLLDIVDAGDPDGVLTPDNVSRMLLKLIGAVGFVHAQGMLHRDISPDNVLVDRSGEPILIDFGAAREQATKKSRVLSAIRVVKDGYSPQEFYVQGAKQGDFSDLYALGATFHHVISGEAPPDSQLRLTRIAEGAADPYQPLEGRVEGYAPGVLASIDKALMVLPKDRIQNAAAWLAMIDAAAPARAGGSAAGAGQLLDAVEAILVPGPEADTGAGTGAASDTNTGTKTGAEPASAAPAKAPAARLAQPAPRPAAGPAAGPASEPMAQPMPEAEAFEADPEPAAEAFRAEPETDPAHDHGPGSVSQVQDFRTRAAARAAPAAQPRRAKGRAKGRGGLLLAGCALLALTAGGALWTVGGEDLVRGSSRVTVNVGTGGSRTQQVPVLSPGEAVDSLIRRAPSGAAAPQSDGSEDAALAVPPGGRAAEAEPALVAVSEAVSEATPGMAAAATDAAPLAEVTQTSAQLGGRRTAPAATGVVLRAVPAPGAGVRPRARPARGAAAGSADGSSAPVVNGAFVAAAPAQPGRNAAAAGARPAPIAALRLAAPAAPGALAPAGAGEAAPAPSEASAEAASPAPDATRIAQSAPGLEGPAPSPAPGGLPVELAAADAPGRPAPIAGAPVAERAPGALDPLPAAPAARAAAPAGTAAPAFGDEAGSAPASGEAAPIRSAVAALDDPAGTDAGARAGTAPEPLPAAAPAQAAGEAPAIVFGEDSSLILMGDAAEGDAAAVPAAPASAPASAPAPSGEAAEPLEVAAAPEAPAPAFPSQGSSADAPAASADGLFMIVDDAAPAADAPEGLRVVSGEWNVEPPFSTAPALVDGVMHHAIASVSQGDPQMALNRWIEPGMVIYAVDGEMLEAGRDFGAAFAGLARPGGDGLLGAELLVEDAAAGRVRQVDLRLDAHREVRLASGLVLEFRRVAGRGQARVLSAPPRSGLEIGDTLLEEAGTGTAIDGEEALGTLGRRLAGGSGTAAMVLLRGGERITVPVEFGAAG